MRAQKLSSDVYYTSVTLQVCSGVMSSRAAYPELYASHSHCLSHFNEGRAVSGADGINADAGEPGTAQGSAIRPKI